MRTDIVARNTSWGKPARRSIVEKNFVGIEVRWRRDRDFHVGNRALGTGGWRHASRLGLERP